MQEEQTQQNQQLVDELVNEISALVDTLQQQQQREQQEQQEQEKQEAEEQKKEAEQQKKEEQVTQKTLQLLEDQNKSLQTLVKTLSTDSETTTGTDIQIIQKLDEISTKIDSNSKVFVEASWMLVLSIVFAVGLKLFWDNVLKW